MRETLYFMHGSGVIEFLAANRGDLSGFTMGLSGRSGIFWNGMEMRVLRVLV